MPLGSTAEAAVAAALSRFHVGSRTKLPVTTNRLNRLLAFCADAAPLADGEPTPNLTTRAWPTAAWALKELGMTQLEVIEVFHLAEARRGVAAALDVGMLGHFHPRELWPVAALLIDSGPPKAGEIVERAVWAYSRIEVPASKRREAGPPAQSAVNDMLSVARRLFACFVELRGRGHPYRPLANWQAIPPLRAPKNGREGWETHAPPLHKIRLARTALDQRLRKALGVRPENDLLGAVRQASDTRLARGGPVFSVLRNLVALDLLLVTASRPEAIAQLMRSDFVTDHVGVPPDNRDGYALHLRPGKSLTPDEVRVKVLPPGLGREVEAYLLFLERATPVLHRWRRNQSTTTPSRVPDDFPLLVSDRCGFRPFGQRGLRRLMSGRSPDLRGRRCEALVPRERGLNPRLNEEERRCAGYEPREYRHAGFKLAERSGQLWNEEHAGDGAEPAPEPRLYAHALTDHAEADDPLRAIYGDHNTKAHYELLAGRAIEGNWRLLTTDEGLRPRPNLGLIQQLAAEYRALDGHLEYLRREAQARYGDPGPKLPPKILRPQLPGHATESEKLDRIVATTDLLLERQDLALELNAELRRHLTAVLAMQEELALTAKRREELLAEINSLCYERTRWERIPDSEPPGAERLTIDVSQILEGRGTPRALAEAEPEPVRDWLTTTEFDWAVDVNHSTVHRWCKGENLPREAARRPWEAEAIPIDRSLGSRFTRLWVPGVKHSFWPTPASRARVSELLAQWPDKQGWMDGEEPGWRCLRPLALPPPFDEQYAHSRKPARALGAQ